MTRYTVNVAGLTRSLPLFRAGEIQIAGFVLFGDVEITRAAAAALLERVPAFDRLLTSEAKSIPLVYEMARMSGKPYHVARKGKKVYMRDVISRPVRSITTEADQVLYLDGSDAAALAGSEVLIADDVVSTGASLAALRELTEAAGGRVCGQAAVFAEGEAARRTDLIYLAGLPLFDTEGNPI